MDKNKIILQGYIGNSPVRVSDTITASKALCKLKINDHYGIGFFLKIKKFIFLITNYSTYYINNEVKNIDIQLKDKSYSLNLEENERKMKFIKKKDIIAIEIIEEDEIKKEINIDNILKIDLNYKDGYKIYLNKTISCFNLSNDKFSLNTGKVINIDKIKDFKFKFSLQKGSMSYGSPIILVENSRVIGISTKSSQKDNFGTFLGELIQLYDDSKDKNKIIKVKIKDIMNYPKPICKVYPQDQYYKPKNGFFISLGKKNFLFTQIKKEESIELEENIKIILYNGKEYYIKLNKNERIIRFIQDHFFSIIEILGNDALKDDIIFLKCDFNCHENFHEYKDEKIFIMSFFESNYELKFGEIINIKDKIYLKINNYDHLRREYCPIISTKSLKVLGILGTQIIEKSLFSKKIYGGILISKIKDIIMENKQRISLSCLNVPLKSFSKISKSICFLPKNKGNGFFINIKKEIELYFLVINLYHYKKKWKKLYFKIENENFSYNKYCLNLNDNMRIIIEVDKPLYFIQILDEDEIKKKVNFLRCETEVIRDYDKLDICTTFFSSINYSINCASGKTIKESDNSKGLFYYSMDMSSSLSCAPIISMDNLKVIGIHCSRDNENEDYENVYYGYKIKDILVKIDKQIGNIEINNMKVY